MNRVFPTLSAATTTVSRRCIHLISKPLSWVGIALSIWLVPITGTMRPALGAERIYVYYGALERSLSVASLAKYAKTGKVDDELADYTQRLNRQQLDQLRRVLLTRMDLSPVAVSQFFYSPIGATLLQRLGQVIQTKAGKPGFYAIRAALILAAADPQQGFTLLNLLQKFPTSGIRIDLARSLQISGDLEKLINQTNQAVALVSQQSAAEATTANPTKVNFFRLPDLRQRGRFTWNKQTLRLNDTRRARIFPADIYLPSVRAPAPLIVISHGLGSDRTSFEYLAEQLASYGFAVAVPEHPGSNAKQLQALLAGLANQVAEPSEFVNRPLDVKFLLDELQRRSQSDPTFKVNLQQVGVIGQSFGGYTALALAGAPLNFEQLHKDCKALNNSLNVSLVLQCRAVELPTIRYNLRDERVKAAIAINPIDSSVFGQASLSQIKVPVMLVGGSNDTIAPALAEQLQPFTWLTTPKKYLVVIQGGTHFSTIGETNSDIQPLPIPTAVIGPDPALARLYMNSLSVAFFQTYVAGAPQYLPYLSASYAQSISQAPLSLSLVDSLTATELAQAINGSNTNAATQSP